MHIYYLDIYRSVLKYYLLMIFHDYLFLSFSDY